MARLREWIKDDGRMVYLDDGKYAEEVKRAKVEELMAEYKGAGKIKIADKDKYENALEKFNKMVLLSDDPHILALAEASGATMLCTGDKKLIKDFEKHFLKVEVYPDSEVYPNSREGQEIIKKAQEKVLDKNKCP